MADIPVSVAGNLAQKVVDRAITEAKYLCCFKRYVEDFEKEKEKLSATKKSVGDDIEEARQRNENEIDHETQQWLKEVDSLIQEDPKAKKKWVFGLCTNCIWQYGRGKELFQKTQDIPKLIERRKDLVRVARSAGPVGMEYHSLSDFIHFESRKAKFEQLKEALKNNDNHMIGLQGMGGTGKTTMAKEVGKEVEESKLFDKVIFIVVSNPPDLKRIQGGIARHLGLPLEEGNESESLWSRISNGGEKLLIILDDVWQELNLKDIGIPVGFHQKGHCCVLLTTRDMRVCKKMGCQKMINLELLSKEDALNLFLAHVGMTVDGPSNDMKNMASNIVKECGRLPVAIAAVAKTLKFEPLEDWKATLIRLQNFDPTLHDIDEDLIEAYKSLSLSYDNLKNEKAKELFLLYSLFPEDLELPIENFSRIAIGLGLCGKVDKYYIARSLVPEIIHKLIDSSLLLRAEKRCVKMHDLVREVAQWIGNKEIQVIMDSETILKENIRYSSWTIDGAIPNHLDGKKLEFLLIRINAEEFVKLPDELFKDMIRLRVLILITADLRKTPTLSLPLSFHSLRNLRSLILNGWKLGDISILGNLQSLETLELTSCSITKFPNEIQALEKLRLLGLKYCKIERHNPFKVIEGISQLEELYYVENIHNPDIKNEDELETENEVEEINQVGTFSALQRYHIFARGSSGYRGVHASVSRCFKPGVLKEIISEETFKFLAARAEILELGKYHEAEKTNIIPDIVPMKDLIKLSLDSCSGIECVIHTKNLLSDVTIFSKLVELKLYGMDVKELCCGPLPIHFFKQLERLRLMKCRRLESPLFKWKLDLGKLKSIELINCSLSSLFHPSTAWSLKQLETLQIIDCKQLKYIITNEGAEEEKVDVHNNIIFPSLKEIVISEVPKFINILESQSYHHRSCIMQNSSPSATIRDGLNIVKDGSPSYSLSWAPLCCFRRKPSATTIDNPPYVSEVTLPDRTSSQSQASKTELVLDTVQCLLRPPLNLHNMSEMTITHCSNITSLFTFPIASSMLFLEKLEVNKCHGLKHLIADEGDGHPHMNNSSIFPKLNKVSIKNCRLLESLFPASHCTTLDHLESVEIYHAHSLRYVFGKCHCEDKLANHNQINVEIRLPSLEELVIDDVPNIINICCENSYMTTLSLKQFGLIECPQLPLRSLSDSMVGLHEEREEDLTKRKAMEILQPENMEHLYLNNVVIEKIYDLERPQIQGPVESMLEMMWLKNLADLRYICVGPKNILSLQNLSDLKISGCKKLEVIFSASILRSLPELKELFVLDCEKLVEIIEESEQNSDLLHQVCFPKLTKIYVKKCKRLKCLFSISTCGMLPNLEQLKVADASELVQVFRYKQGETKEMVMKDVFPNLETIVLKSLPSLDCVCQGIDFQTVRKRLVHDCPTISLTSTFTISDDDGDDKDAFEYRSSASSSEDEESLEDQDDKVKATSDEAAFQSKKEATKEIVDEVLEIQEENNNTPNLTESTKAAANETFKQVPAFDIPAMSASSSNSIPQQKPSLIKERKEPSVRESLILEKATIANEVMDSEEQSKESRGDGEALGESMSTNEAAGRVDKPLDNTQEVDEPTNESSSKERSNEMKDLAFNSVVTELEDTSPSNIDASVGDGSSSEKYNKPSSSTHCSLTITKELNETARGVDTPVDNTQDVEEPTNQCSSKERSNITTLAIPSTLVEMKDLIPSTKPQTVSATTDPEPRVSQSNQADISGNSEFSEDKIIVNQTEIDNPKQFEDDDLIRLFRTIEAGADIGDHKPYVSKIAALEDDNKVAKSFSDVESLLKMGVNEIANSEENSIRLENALNFLSTHYSKDGPPSHILKDKVDSMHQEISSILSSFKQASDRLATIDTFTELEEKEKSINEELPQRKEAAITLISEICETKKSMDEAQKKEVELKEQIARLQAELNRKEKEIRDCEIKLSSLEEQKKKNVWDTIGFLEECEAVKKERSRIVEEKMKARQELEKVDVKWSSCEAKWWKTILLQEIYVKQKL